MHFTNTKSFLFTPRYSIVPFSVRWRQVVGEFIGTAFFLYFVCASVEIPTTFSEGSGASEALVTAFLQGFAILSLVSVFRVISGGHLNPAVTTALAITRHIPTVRAIFYILAQLSGAIVGTYLFKASIPSEITLGATTVANGVSVGSAFLIEFIITSMLILVVFGTAVDGVNGTPQLVPIPIGLSVA